MRTVKFNFTFHFKDENVRLQDIPQDYDVLIERDGSSIRNQNSSAREISTVYIVGGINAFEFEKEYRSSAAFFITEQQKATIYSLMRDLSLEDILIEANEETLFNFISSLYTNLRN